MLLMLSLVLQMHCETSGKEALKWIEQNKVFPDLILLDCMMPGMSGITILLLYQTLPM